MIRYLGPVILGIAGVAVLASLGFWQLSRLAEKRAQIAEIEAMIGAEPVPLPADPQPARDRYLPVRAEGRFTGEAVTVLASQRAAGTGVHVIGVLETDDGRRVLVDRGFLPDDARAGFDADSGPVTVQGNLDWPRDADRFTPAPDLGRGLWFSRAVEPIAAHLDSAPVMIVARAQSPAPAAALRPVPVTAEGVRNDHLEYAITWFALALTWAGMTVFLMWRIRRETSA